MKLSPFHLAIITRDINEARDFYGHKMAFNEGRSSDTWIDFDMFGHQLVTHLNPKLGRTGQVSQMSNIVDGKSVSVPHFGIVLELNDWQQLAERVSRFIDHFMIEPSVRFAGEPAEQATMFFTDPSGNALEFKAFKHIEKALFHQ